MILDLQQDDDVDMDYFRELIKSKVDRSGQQSYQEAVAIRQMSGDCDPEDELANALNEIRKNEKEIGIIAAVAQTLIERTSELQALVGAQQIEINQQSSTEATAVANHKAIEEEMEDLRANAAK